MDFGPANTNLIGVLVPLSECARKSVDHGQNRRLVDWTRNVLPPSDPMTPKHKRVIKVSFPALMGRRCFTVGSSRLSHYELPLEADYSDVSALHFTLVFDYACRTLRIRNASLHGTWVSAGFHDDVPILLLNEAPLEVYPVTHIQCGLDNRFRFLLILNQPAARDEFDSHLTRYVQSIGRSSPSTTAMRKRSRSLSHDIERYTKRTRICS